MNILIIANHTFPKQGPRAFRTAELSEQLASMGNRVVLYTVHGKYDYTNYEIETGVIMRNIKTYFATDANDGTHRYNLFDKVMTKYLHRLIVWPQCEFHFCINKIIKDNPNMDLLITIAHPHSIHSGAARAKRRHPDIFPKTWICDCGDPFMLNPFMKAPHYLKRYEDMWCSECNYIAVPTDSSYKGYYEQYWDKIRVIPQGFKFERTPIATYKPNNIPTFLFVGTIYPGVRDPHAFMDYLLTLDKPYKFKMMMRTPLEERYITDSNGQIEYITGKGRKEVVWECSKADFLINICNPTSVQSPSKLIDYGIADRPILDIDNNFSDPTSFLQFYQGDFLGKHEIHNIDQYKIEHVAQQFLDLVK